MNKAEALQAQDSMFPADEERTHEGKVPDVTIEEISGASGSLLEAAVKTTMEREVATVFHRLEAEKQRFEFHQRLAKLFVASGLFEDLKGDITAPQAIARAMLKIELGWSIGLSPAESIRSIYFTPGGKPEIDSAVRAARMKRSGYDWRIQQLDAEACILEMWKDGHPLLDSKKQQAVVSFTMKDAEGVKVWNRKQGKMIPLTESNPTYKSYPRNMLFSRCITNAQRWFAPEALNGVNFADTTERFELEDLEVGKGAPRPLFTERDEVASHKAALAAELAKESAK